MEVAGLLIQHSWTFVCPTVRVHAYMCVCTCIHVNVCLRGGHVLELNSGYLLTGKHSTTEIHPQPLFQTLKYVSLGP